MSLSWQSIITVFPTIMWNQRINLTVGVCLLQVVDLVSTNPVNANALARRDSTVTTTVTATEIMTTTIWLDPRTVTVNPLDPTITRDGGWTFTSAPPPFISTVTSSCITYEFSTPPDDRPTITTTITTTTSARSSITVTDTNRPPSTSTIWHTPTITLTTPTATHFSYHCLNTLIVQYHPFEHLTWTWSYWEHQVITTGLCLTTTTRATTIPGVTLPAEPQPTLADWEYFSEAGQSRATKNTVAVVTDTRHTFPGTTTLTVCDERNPRPTTTLTITITRRSTVTQTVTVEEGECTTTTTTGGNVDKEGVGVGVVEARQDDEPVEVHTVVYTTVTVINNTVHTFTGTAVLDVVTQSFPITRVAYFTTTGTGVVTATRTETVCATADGI
ncbi:hypothetical protein MMYC01_210339 [Madurella mycetomatis]|uniref:Uncharacterized protein n=1 Tax=Madurella mycetomatis TaxID=100816 RepID=A0A175VQS2_9PEZI|nr:hypothetical protein MMYC01_210339 [Madurella mycetomatis]